MTGVDHHHANAVGGAAFRPDHRRRHGRDGRRPGRAEISAVELGFAHGRDVEDELVETHRMGGGQDGAAHEHGLAHIDHDAEGAGPEEAVAEALDHAAAAVRLGGRGTPGDLGQVDYHAVGVAHGKDLERHLLRELERETRLVGLRLDRHVDRPRRGGATRLGESQQPRERDHCSDELAPSKPAHVAVSNKLNRYIYEARVVSSTKTAFPSRRGGSRRFRQRSNAAPLRPVGLFAPVWG